MNQHVLQILERRAGIDLDRDGQHERVEALIAERARDLGVPVDDYVLTLGRDESELSRVIEGATNGYTWFYRDAPQMEAIDRLLSTAWGPERPVNAWVPACSTGEDAYTLAMIAARRGRPIQILATDINERALAVARAGRYSAWSARELPVDLRLRLRERPRQEVEIAAADRAAVRFLRHNLLDLPPPPPPGAAGWDLVLCRNVLIYFAPKAVDLALRALARSLSPDGWLLLSPAEVPHAVSDRLDLVSAGGAAALRRARPKVHVPAPPAPPAPPRPPRAPRALPAPPRKPRPEAGLDRLLESADAALEQGKLAAACAGFACVLELNPFHELALLGAGVTLYHAGDFSSALRPLSQAALQAPGNWAAHYFQAICLENLGRAEEARRSYRNAVEAGDLRVPLAGGLLRRVQPWRGDLLALCRRRAT